MPVTAPLCWLMGFCNMYVVGNLIATRCEAASDRQVWAPRGVSIRNIIHFVYCCNLFSYFEAGSAEKVVSGYLRWDDAFLAMETIRVKCSRLFSGGFSRNSKFNQEFLWSEFSGTLREFSQKILQQLPKKSLRRFSKNSPVVFPEILLKSLQKLLKIFQRQQIL